MSSKPGFDGRRPCEHQSDVMAFASVLTNHRKQTGVNRNEFDYSNGLNFRCMNGIRGSLVVASWAFPGPSLGNQCPH